jgi:hypothetical protein
LDGLSDDYVHGMIRARQLRGGGAIPRLQRKRAVSLGGSPAVAGVWSEARLDDELQVRPLTDRSGWHTQVMAGHNEIARLAYLPRVDPAGAWRWAIKFGDDGFAGSYADALAALTQSWAATRRRLR